MGKGGKEKKRKGREKGRNGKEKRYTAAKCMMVLLVSG